jgi:hypothetical protein
MEAKKLYVAVLVKVFERGRMPSSFGGEGIERQNRCIILHAGD